MGGTADVAVGRDRVGKEATAVFVGSAGGKVGVFNGTDWVNCACTVSAAAVKTASGSSVAGALEGKLHAERTNRTTLNTDAMRINLDILLSSFFRNNFTRIQTDLYSPLFLTHLTQ